MRKFDLIAFDVDGTLVQSPGGLTVWEVLNEHLIGTSEINRQRYALFRQGKLSYADWVALDVEGWREAGAGREDLIEGLAPLTPIRGATETLAALGVLGYRLIVVSGTLELMLDTLFPGHPFEEVFANRIYFDAAGNISHWEATPFDMEGKADALRDVARRHGIPLARCAFVGDSSNDVWIAAAAGFSIALNPRSAELERVAGAVVRSEDLTAILPYFSGPDCRSGNE